MTGRWRWFEFHGHTYVVACRLQKLVIRDFLEKLHQTSHAGEQLCELVNFSKIALANRQQMELEQNCTTTYLCMYI